MNGFVIIFNPNSLESEFEINYKFLCWFYQTDQQLVIVKNSAFHRKIRSYAKWLASQRDLKYFNLLKPFMLLIEKDNSRVAIIENQELPIEIIDKLHLEGTNFSSDQYLFEAAYYSDSKIIVTTDQKLIDFMGTSEHYKLIHLDDFIKLEQSEF